MQFVPRLARTLSEKMTGSCGMIEIRCRSCLRCVEPVGDPLTKTLPSIPLLIRNKAEIRLLFPAPVLPTFKSWKL